MRIEIEFSDDERAAIDAAVLRQQASEPELTGEALVGRMAKKLAVGWAHEAASRAAEQHLAEIRGSLQSLAPAARLETVGRLRATVDEALLKAPVALVDRPGRGA